MTKKVIVDERSMLPDDMTQEELDDIIKSIQEMIDNGTLEENSREVSEEELEALGIDINSFFSEETQLH